MDLSDPVIHHTTSNVDASLADYATTHTIIHDNIYIYIYIYFQLIAS